MPGFFKSKNSAAPAEPASTNWSARVRQGLSRTRDNLGRRLSGLLGGGKIDDALYEELETILLTADAGVNATTWLLGELRSEVKRKGLTDAAQLKGALQEALTALLEPLVQPLDTDTSKPFIIMLAGVNGAGKTTTLKTLSGLLRPRLGSVQLDGAALEKVAPHEIVRRGVAHGRGRGVRVAVAERGLRHEHREGEDERDDKRSRSAF